MVISAIFGGLGAAANAAGGILQARSNDRTNERNYHASLLDYYDRQSQRRQQLWESQRREREAKLGSTDAFGNRSYFDPDRGWVVDVSDETQEEQDYLQALTNRSLQTLQPLQQGLEERALHRGYEQSDLANSLLEEFRRLEREDPEAIRRLMNQAGSRGVNQAFDDNTEIAARQLLRSGSTNNGKFFEDINRQRSDALRDVFLNAQLNSRDIADSRFNNSRSNLLNFYSQLATPRLSPGTVNGAGAARGSEQLAERTRLGAQERGDNASNMVLNAITAPLPTRPFQRPRTQGAAIANGIGGIFNNISDSFSP